MHPFEHPETIMLIHYENIRRELERDKRARIGREDIPGRTDHIGPGRLRQTLSHGLIALARRISPDDTSDAGLPAGARH